jgi:hypothetical protein
MPSSMQIMRREFCANPIVLMSSGIDIILGMEWSLFQAVSDSH